MQLQKAFDRPGVSLRPAPGFEQLHDDGHQVVHRTFGEVELVRDLLGRQSRLNEFQNLRLSAGQANCRRRPFGADQFRKVIAAFQDLLIAQVNPATGIAFTRYPRNPQACSSSM